MGKQFHVFLEYRNWLKIDDLNGRRGSLIHMRMRLQPMDALLPYPTREVQDAKLPRKKEGKKAGGLV